MLDHINVYHDHHRQRLSIRFFKGAILRVMEEEEEEIECNINNITCHTSFQSPVDTNVQKKDAKFSLER